MSEKKIYTNGHYAVDNGCGDWDLFCSDGQFVRFLPYLTYSMVKTDCNVCGERIEFVRSEDA